MVGILKRDWVKSVLNGTQPTTYIAQPSARIEILARREKGGEEQEFRAMDLSSWDS
jgi:hypothetical protein